MNRYIIIAGCFLTALLVAYFVRCELLKKQITDKVGDSDLLKSDLSKLTAWELAFLRDVTDAMTEAPSANGLNPKLEEFAKDDKWKSIMAKTGGLKSFGFEEKKSTTTTKK